MPAPSAVVTVNGTPIPVVGTSGINVAGGSTITIALVSVAGVETWDVNCTMSDGINANGQFPQVEATKLLDNTHFTCQFTVPALQDIGGGSPHVTWNIGSSLQFVSVVNAGKFNQNVFTFGVFVIGSSTLRLVFDGENLETNATYGVAPDINDFLIGRALGPAGLGGGDLRGLYPNPNVFSISGFPTGNTVNVFTPTFNWASLDASLVADSFTFETGSFLELKNNILSWLPSTAQSGPVWQVNINATNNSGQLPNGTNLALTTANSTGTDAPAGYITLTTGNGNRNGQGGNIDLQTGNGGTGGTGAQGGDIILSTGNGGSGGANGTIRLQGSNADLLTVNSTEINFTGSVQTVFGNNFITVNGPITFNNTTKLHNGATVGNLIQWETTVTPDFSTYALVLTADSDYTLTAGQYNNMEIVVTRSVSFSANHNLIFPLSGTYLLHNALGGFDFTVKGATGTGFTVNDGHSALVWSDGTNFYGVGGNSGVVWADDLAGSTDLGQFVVALTGSGGTVDVHATNLEWDASISNPQITQLSTGSATGKPFTIQAQNVNSSALFIGGNLNLSSGQSQLGPDGYVNLQVGGTNAIEVGPPGIIVPAFNTAGVVQNTSAGLLFSGQVAAASLAPGSHDQLLDTNHSGTATAEWFTVGGDLTYANHIFTVVGLQGVTLPPPTGPGNTALIYDSGSGSLVWQNPLTGITWNGDLLGSSNSIQWVAAISGSGGAGGTVPINAVELQFAANQLLPKFDQADASTGNGQPLRIHAQNATASLSTGGNLILESGTGAGVAGNVQLVVGSNTQLTLTAGQLQWANIGAPTINQVAVSLGSGNDFTVRAQGSAATSGTANGGNLDLSSGNHGTGSSTGNNGSVNLQSAGTTWMSVSDSNVNIAYMTSTGIVHNNSSGNLSSSLIVNADVDPAANIDVDKLTKGTSGQFIVTGPTIHNSWVSITGDINSSNATAGLLTVIGLQGRTLASTAPSNGQVLTWNSGSSQWQPGAGAATGIDFVGNFLFMGA